MDNIKLTDYITGLPVAIEKSDIESYRGNTGHTSIYLNDGGTIEVLEDFETVDNLVESEVKNG